MACLQMRGTCLPAGLFRARVYFRWTAGALANLCASASKPLVSAPARSKGRYFADPPACCHSILVVIPR